MNPRPVRNYQALNTPSMKRPALAIKSITGQTQFLVPVPHSSTKSKLVMVPKQRLLLNYIKPQVLKIPTITTSHSQAINSTGGAAAGGQQSIRQYQSVAATVAQQLQQQHHHNTRCLPTAISVATSATTADGSVSVSATTTTTHSLLVRSAAHKSPKVPLIRSLANATAGGGGGGQRVTAVAAAVAAPKQLTDKQSKDLFMMTLGLVTKESLAELQSRKCERKRRTTANPQFSSAALEAKRITKLEIAERKAKRRLLNNMVDVSGGGGGGQHTGGTNHHTTAAGHSHSSSLSSSAAVPPPSSAAAQSKTSHHIHNNSSNNNNHNNSNSGTNSATNGGVAANVENPKAIGVEQQEISPGLYIVTKIGKQLSANCFVCEELCECDCDSILFCKTCKTLFHATCTTSRREIVDNHALPKCLKCDGQRRRADELLARKRDERDNLVVKKKEFEDQLQQMKRALQQLKIKIKEKSDEKVSLVANHEIVQQKVDKIIETLKLVEDTSEWEDELNDDHNRRRPLDRQSGPSATAAAFSSAQQTLSSSLQLPPSGQSSDQSMDGMAEEEVVDEEVEEVVEGEDDMDEEANRAAEQLVRLNAQHMDEELVEDEEYMDGDEEEEQELIDDSEAKEAIDEEEEGVDDDMSDNESTTVRTPSTTAAAAPPQSTIAIDMDESEEGDRHLITGGHRSAGIGSGGKHSMGDEDDDDLFSLVCNESVCDDYVEEVRHHSVGSSGAGDMDAESVGFFDTDVSAPTGAAAPASASVVTTASAHQSQHQKVSQQFGSGS